MSFFNNLFSSIAKLLATIVVWTGCIVLGLLGLPLLFLGPIIALAIGLEATRSIWQEPSVRTSNLNNESDDYDIIDVG